MKIFYIIIRQKSKPNIDIWIIGCYNERTKNRKKIVKRIAAMGAAVMMMGTMSVIGAGAVSAKYIGTTTKSTANAPKYISCYDNGSYTNGYVSGTCWTKTSTAYNTLNPNCAFNGEIRVNAGCSTASNFATHQNASSAVCSIYGKTIYTVIISSHYFNSTNEGNFNYSLRAE